jgi:hypothetical protein
LGEAAFHVSLEVDHATGFISVADLGTVTTGKTLARPTVGTLVNGNDAAYRVSFDSGPIDLDIPVRATLRPRWISGDRSRSVVFGLDVSLRFAGIVGDANIDEVFNSIDLVQVFQTGEYEDSVVGNSTWSDGDWTNDNEFSSADLVAAFQDAQYVAAASPTTPTVPEPGSLWWIVPGLLCQICVARRRKR